MLHQALRITPSTSHRTSTTNLTTIIPTSNFSKGAPSAPGIHDSIRSSNSDVSSPTSTQSAHPLEARLLGWQSTQQSLKMIALRRTYGIAEPVRRGMELNIANSGEWKPNVLGGSAGVHGDILAGRDTEMTWEDVYKGTCYSNDRHGLERFWIWWEGDEKD